MCLAIPGKVLSAFKQDGVRMAKVQFGGVVREAEEKGAFIPGTGEQIRLARKFDEEFLDYVTRVVFVAGEIKQEGEQRLGVFIVELF